MKHIRSALFVLLGAACFASPAAAQQTPPQLQPPVATVVTPEAFAAGEALYQSIVLDSGVLEALVEYTRADFLPGLRTTVMNSPMYLNAAPTRRDALLAVIDNLPEFLRQEFEAQFVATGARVAPRFAARMSAEHMAQTAAFFRSEPMRAPWREFATEVVLDRPRASSIPEWQTIGTFAETEAGRAFAEQEDRLGGILTEEMQETMILLAPRIRTLAAGQICDALEDDCPTHMREQAGGI